MSQNIWCRVQIIPQNPLAGSIIVTSLDGKAAGLIHRAKCTKVDKMETKEGEALVAKTLKIDILKASMNVTSCLEKLVTRLDGITIALDLASARIRDDIGDDGNGEGPVANPIEQSLVDLEAHERALLSDYERSAPSAYKKTIRSVWETVLSSLERCAYCHLMLQDPKAAATIVQESCQLSHASLRANDPTVEFRDTCLKALAL